MIHNLLPPPFFSPICALHPYSLTMTLSLATPILTAFLLNPLFTVFCVDRIVYIYQVCTFLFFPNRPRPLPIIRLVRCFIASLKVSVHPSIRPSVVPSRSSEITRMMQRVAQTVLFCCSSDFFRVISILEMWLRPLSKAFYNSISFSFMSAPFIARYAFCACAKNETICSSMPAASKVGVSVRQYPVFRSNCNQQKFYCIKTIHTTNFGFALPNSIWLTVFSCKISAL